MNIASVETMKNLVNLKNRMPGKGLDLKKLDDLELFLLDSEKNLDEYEEQINTAKKRNKDAELL